MKKAIEFLTLIFVLCLVVFTLYNCNKNETATPKDLENCIECYIETINLDKANRKTLVDAPSRRHMEAIYSQLSPEQKRNIWIDKVLTILDEEPLYTEGENILFTDLIEFLKPSHFIPETESNRIIQEYLGNLTYKLINYYGWSEAKVYYWFVLPHLFEELPVNLQRRITNYMNNQSSEEVVLNYEDKKTVLDLRQTTSGEGPDGPGPNTVPPCQCSYDIACGIVNQGSCREVSCEQKRDCCGFFGTSPCTGRCD